MKKFLVLLLVLTLFLLCGCTSGTKSSGDSSSQTDQTSNSTSLNSFEVSSFKTKDGNDSYMRMASIESSRRCQIRKT
ncbi:MULTISPECIES: hypothetical protein [Acetobacterium]|jgi:uncharacterized protein YcfL|uniref:Uncharacterized protein n=1 Tax=Acetobacterium wieringae TaxID=52694 RepID=A0A1F2PN06_9FIRM|nr:MULTISPECIES: hypothetical protein [Acetobacterium]OFV72325.1 hypothetical protein ACWI_02360 [Acetobacterium wieringae]OXS25309.1 MAG: hypothetical protein BI182_16655 [Acetobacterium sp. MES1]URN84808.1 hypothetical protein CHL1_000393 [Acetobacterium wieringae]